MAEMSLLMAVFVHTMPREIFQLLISLFGCLPYAWIKLILTVLPGLIATHLIFLEISTITT